MGDTRKAIDAPSVMRSAAARDSAAAAHPPMDARGPRHAPDPPGDLTVTKGQLRAHQADAAARRQQRA